MVDPLRPFLEPAMLEEVKAELAAFAYKLYGPIPLRFYRGAPSDTEFDLNLGLMHFTEADFQGISEIFHRLNGKWKTEMTFCVYPAKESNRDMILNVRGSPIAPSEID